MYPLENYIQQYAWGSKTAIAELMGRPSPTAHPEAELWMGDHPRGPSKIREGGGWCLLSDVIARNPRSALGDRVAARFGAKLPFLFKILAAETPLSLQAHPTIEQARTGFDADEAAGVPLDAPERNYRDGNHKPELLCALTEFEVLCGFRRLADTLGLFDALDVGPLRNRVDALRRAPNDSGLRQLFSSLMTAGAPERAELVGGTLEACVRHCERRGPFARECEWAIRIGAVYPGDVGVIIGLLLNLVRLQTGEAVYLPAGNLHCYLQGVGIEIMASSDNVLRGGLTVKHIDVPELLRILSFAAGPIVALLPERRRAGEQVYDTPADEFCLARIDVGPTASFISEVARGPEILLCTEGQVSVSEGDTLWPLAKGASIFVPVSGPRYRLEGKGTVFRATVGSGLQASSPSIT
jgi:mannose-6-phosphate isomerase